MSLRKFFLLYSVLLMLVLVGVFLGYRTLVTIPKVQSNVLAYQQREIDAVQQSFYNQFEVLSALNYDYAIWDDSYDFYSEQDEDFINTNFIPDTFVSLKIDGIYYVSLQGETVWGMGFDWKIEEELDFMSDNGAYSVIANRLLNAASSSSKTLQISGFLQTDAGATMYSACLLRHSDLTGPNIGALIFLKKLRPSIVNNVAKLAGVKISSSLPNHTDVRLRKDLMQGVSVENILPNRYFYLGDVLGEPVTNLDIEHSLYEKLKLFDNQTIYIIALLAIIPISLQLLVHFSLLRPLLRSIKNVGHMLESNQLKALQSSNWITEINSLNRGFNRLIETVTEQKNKMENLSLLDGLTNIANRRAFEIRFANAWKAMQRNRETLTVIMCDIDFFKAYNDNYGHQAGDSALKIVAQALQKRVARPHDMVARYGGEEFVIILPATDFDHCQQLIDSIQALIADLNIVHKFSSVSNIITISVGAAVIEDVKTLPNNAHPEQFLHVADKALYDAKKQGRNSYVIHRFDT